MTSARRLLMTRPRPVPPNWRVVELSAWLNGLKSRSLLLERDADAGIGHGEMETNLARRRRWRLGAADTTTSPLSVNLIALPMRLRSTWRWRVDIADDARKAHPGR